MSVQSCIDSEIQPLDDENVEIEADQVYYQRLYAEADAANDDDEAHALAELLRDLNREHYGNSREISGIYKGGSCCS